MDYLELFIAIGIMILLTFFYFLLRKFIAWAIDDDVRWHKKQGHLGPDKQATKIRKQLVFDKLTGGYLLFMFVLVLYIGKLICDAL